MTGCVPQVAEPIATWYALNMQSETITALRNEPVVGSLTPLLSSNGSKTPVTIITVERTGAHMNSTEITPKKDTPCPISSSSGLTSSHSKKGYPQGEREQKRF